MPGCCGPIAADDESGNVEAERTNTIVLLFASNRHDSDCTFRMGGTAVQLRRSGKDRSSGTFFSSPRPLLPSDTQLICDGPSKTRYVAVVPLVV